MIHIKRYRSMDSTCNKLVFFGYKGEKVEYCLKHKLHGSLADRFKT